MKQQTCALEGCKKKFTPRRSNHIFCHPDHGRQHHNQRQGLLAQGYETRTCGQCGAEFKPDRKNQRYCGGACGARARNQRRSMAEHPSAQNLTEEQMIERLQEHGFTVYKGMKKEPRVRLANLKTQRYRLGVISDTHLGSLYSQRTHMNDFFETFKRESCDAILHSGDLVHGSSRMHIGMEYELGIHGSAAQTAYAVEHIPDIGIPGYIIDGNHDLSFKKDAGTVVVQDFAQQRNDWTYLGSEGAMFEIGGAKVYMWHGGSGAYAKSYNLQKWAESVAPENKPHVMLNGHLHFQCHVHHRNIECFQLPCVSAQTPFEKRKKLFPVIGALILDLWVSRNGLEDLQTKWLIRRIPLEEDW